MKKVLFLFLCLPFYSFSQSAEHMAAFEKSMPEGLGTPFLLPGPDYQINYQVDLIAEPASARRIRIIDNEKDYRSFFKEKRIEAETFPSIDFAKYDMVLYSACGFCLSVCDLASGHHSCHRPACYYQYRWFLREKARDSVSGTAEAGLVYSALFDKLPYPSARKLEFPVLLRHTNIECCFDPGKKSVYELVIDSDSLYNKVMGWYADHPVKSFPVFDFSKEKLIVRIACHECLIAAASSGSNGENKPNHQGACIYSASWFIISRSSGGN